MAKKIGLALGSGGARGLAHLGVIKTLKKHGIKIDFIAGTSIGALIGGVYAAGKLNELEELLLTMDWKKILSYLDVAIFKNGLLDGEKIRSLLSSQYADKQIEDTGIPFTAIASDIITGKEVRIKLGNLVEAIRASISIPGIFTPVICGNEILADGGLINPVPVNAAREMGADIVIAVDLNSELTGARPPFKNKKIKKKETSLIKKIGTRVHKIEDSAIQQVNNWMKSKGPTIFDVIANAINIMQQKITEENLKNSPPDFLIRPKVGYVKVFDFHLAEQVIAEGERAAEEIIKSIKNNS